jgi:NitT/TauT family transport system substrate-binding protein
MRRAAFLAGTVLAPGARARAQSVVALRIATTAIEGSAGSHFAQALGLFRKYGVNAELIVMRSGEAAAAAVVGGAAEVGVANTLSLAIAHVKGLGLRLIAPASEYVESSPTTALVVARDSVARVPRDLDGKTIAVTALGDLNTISTELWLERNGIDSKRVRFAEMPTAQMPAALDRGTVDAAMISSPSLQIALGSGRIFALPYGAVAGRFIANAWYAKAEWLAGHRDDARRFARAVNEAQQWANRDRAASAKLLVELTKIDPDVVAKMTRTIYAQRFEPVLLQPVVDAAARYKVIPATFPANELYELL